MKIKRILAKDNQEALLKVKMELGPDAVIIHQRKIKPKGFFGFLRKPVIEVVAAREDKPITQVNGFDITVTKPPNKTRSIPDDIPSRIDYQTMEEELKSIKVMLNQLVKNSGDDSTVGNSTIEESLLELILKDNDMDPAVMEKLLSDCNDAARTVHGSAAHEKQVRESIKQCIAKNVMIQPYDPKQKVLVFVGPTGVGKTTTIAKLAARATLNEGKKVGLISADTYRIAAVEQLRTYSDILNIPLKVIYQPDEISEAIRHLNHLDLIMVDTAGRSHRDAQQINELKRLLDRIMQKEVYLLLSCTTRQQDIRDILEKYQFLDDYKVIITKIDEASAYGTLVNVPILTNKAISFMTTGQSVPDDIEAVTVDKIMNLLIKEI